mgnify:CR=1 FL=1
MERTSKGIRGQRLAAATIAALSGLPGAALAAREWNLQTPVTEIARQQYELHTFIFWICVIIFVGVFGVMFYSLFKHRKSVGHQAAQFHENTVVEIVWTVVPFLILFFMAYPATKTILAMKDTTASELTIKVTGYQWKWNYDYLQDGFGFYSNLATPLAQIENREPKGEHYLLEVDNPLVVPVDTKVRVLITAGDVLHAWWVPAFGVKQDAIPGFVRDTWFRAEKTGDFYGQCAELCGKEHAYMPIHVKVVTAAEYTSWVAEQRKAAAAKADDPSKVWTLPDLMARGEKVYAANCAACHQANGKGAGPIKALDGDVVVLDPDHARQIMVLLKGQGGGAMPAWKQLSDTDLAAVVTFTKNSWSNKTGQLVQPAEVQALRDK